MRILSVMLKFLLILHQHENEFIQRERKKHLVLPQAVPQAFHTT